MNVELCDKLKGTLTPVCLYTKMYVLQNEGEHVLSIVHYTIVSIFHGFNYILHVYMRKRKFWFYPRAAVFWFPVHFPYLKLIIL